MTPKSHPGIYGKVPSNGDFVTRRLPAAFVEPWDLWLQDALADSCEQLGRRWLDVYLTSPIWRFALSAGVAGPTSWAGVLMPSVDRVGRYFPLTLACPLPARSNPVGVMAAGAHWFDSAEKLLLTSLQNDFVLDAFDRSVLELGPPPVQGVAPASTQGGGNALRIPVARSADLGGSCLTLLQQALGELYFGFSLWWSHGSELVDPSLLVCQGLPPTHGFAALLAGSWADWGWQEQAPQPDPTDRATGETP